MRDPAGRSAELDVIAVLLDRFNTYRLPYARHLQTRVDRGELLSEYDMRWLNKVFAESAHACRLAKKHARYREPVGQAMSLFGEIIRKGVENERAASRILPHE